MSDVRLEIAHFERNSSTQNFIKIYLIYTCSISVNRPFFEEILSIIQINWLYCDIMSDMSLKWLYILLSNM